MAKAIGKAVKDPAVKAILLRIDSPGGSYLASDTVWNAVMENYELFWIEISQPMRELI